ncbi:MAG: hypothetical protein Q4D19_06995 [Lautropia sp.]|nr:hypothetical protein [Lautropia sp.]
MNRRRRFHQRWLLWGLIWVFVLASLAPAISRMQAAADGGARIMQVAEIGPSVDAPQASPVQEPSSAEALSPEAQLAAATICDPVAHDPAAPAHEPGLSEPESRMDAQSAGQGLLPADLRASLRHVGHAGHHAGILTANSVNVLTQLPIGMPSLDCCPFCSIMADRLAPVWHELPFLLDRTLVRLKPSVREPMAPTVVVLRLPPARAPPASSRHV